MAPRSGIAFAYVSSLLMSSMDTHIVNVMLPSLDRIFHASLVRVEWAVLGYVLSLAVFIPASRWFADRLGAKRVFLAALGIFVAGSAACGLSQSLTWLVAARVAQGAGGGLLTPVVTSMLYRAYPPGERARMTRILIVPIAIGPTCAPPLGGFLLEHASWRWAFFVNVPIGLVTLLVAGLSLTDDHEPLRERFDGWGFVTGGAGLACLLYAITEGAQQGWTSVTVVACWTAALAGLGLFVHHELRDRAPLLRLQLLIDPIFRSTNIANAFATMAFLGGLLYVTPAFLQDAGGHSPVAAGLTVACTALGVVSATQTVGRWYRRVGPRRMVALGQVGLGLGLVVMSGLSGHTSLWVVGAVLVATGYFNGASMIGLQTSMFATVSPAETGSASSLFSAARQVSTGVGVAMCTTVLAAAAPSLGDFRVAYRLAAVCALLGAVSGVLLIRDRDAAVTMDVVAAPGSPTAPPRVSDRYPPRR
jgi:EmrB/QacA subfamily drug resistance transporter